MQVATGLVLLVAGALVVAGLAPAQGAANASGTLASGGTAKGDIALSPGETDTISVDLEAGSRVNFKWMSSLIPSVVFADPDGNAIATTFGGTRSGTMNAWLVPASGRYEFRIASGDGTEGTYTLQVRPYWEKTVVLEGSGTQTLEVGMPAASRVKGRVQPLPGASNPSILSLLSPAGAELLVAPVVGTPGLAKLKPIDCVDAGTYRLTAQAAAGTGGFRATLKRAARRIPLVKVDISNGLDPISYATGGVKSYFDRSCASCHDWAGSYVGVKSWARLALPRIASGNMPKGGPRATPATVSLIKLWITTGYGR